MAQLQAVPLTTTKANALVEEFHRHSGPTAGRRGRFALGAIYEGEVVGVAIVGNPVSRSLADGQTAEVTRLCLTPSAPKNSASFLYGRACRVWSALGGSKVITYTLQREAGTSLRASGFEIEAEVRPHKTWDRQDSHKRRQADVYQEPKLRWSRTVGVRKDEVQWPAAVENATAAFTAKKTG